MRLFKYYLIILTPLIGLYFALRSQLISPIVFISFVIGYYLLRVFVDAQRLISQGIIKKKQWWFMLIPFRRGRYLKQLYWTL